MNEFADNEIAVTALMTIAVGIVLTPMFGAWIWIALLMATWGLWVSANAFKAPGR